ncbi:aromatic acid exporter family protein [Streptomyces sp. NPDC005283]|uniref:FUSC family protein n=1 Tax=Streptomyces sp. NPDC005283 TaxID=3156871 RepID=UPI0034527B23
MPEVERGRPGLPGRFCRYLPGPGGLGNRCRRSLKAGGRRVGRAVRGPGAERDGLLLQVKGAAAVMVAWWVSSWLLPPAVTAFATVTSLLALQATVYRSLWDSAQYLGAMAVGTAMAAAFGSTAGVHAWSVGVLAFITLVAARLQPLGGQGAQVPVVALFAFAGGGGEIDYIGHLVAAAAIGVCCGLAAHFAVAPSPHTDTAHTAIRAMTRRAHSLLQAMAESAEQMAADEKKSKDWARHCEELASQAARARAVVEEAQENTKLNPRRPWSSAPESLQRCHVLISMFERIGTHLRSIARALDYAISRDQPHPAAKDFVTAYAELLHCTAATLECLDPAGGPEQADRLRACVDSGMHRYHDLAATAQRGHLDAPGQWPVYGTALTEAVRILEEMKADLQPQPLTARDDGRR